MWRKIEEVTLVTSQGVCSYRVGDRNIVEIIEVETDTDYKGNIRFYGSFICYDKEGRIIFEIKVNTPHTVQYSYEKE